MSLDINKFLSELNDYIPDIAAKWEPIGIKLGQGTSVSTLRSTEKKASQKLTEVIEDWLESDHIPGDELTAWKTIVEVLRSDGVRLGAKAKKIEDAKVKPKNVSVNDDHQVSGRAPVLGGQGPMSQYSAPVGGPQEATGGEFQEQMDVTDGNPLLLPSLSTAVKKNRTFPVEFAIMTANENEWNTACYFLGDHSEDLASKIDDRLKEDEYSCSSVLTQGIGIEIFDGKYDGFKIIRVSGQETVTVYGVLLKCSDMGSFTGGGSHRTTLRLLKMAQDEKWHLKVIFIVGCCGARFSRPDEQNGLEGAVFIAKNIVQYAIGKFEREREIKYNVQIHNVSKDWDGIMVAKKDSERSINPVHQVLFYSGDFVIKNDDVAADLSGQILNQSIVGFEMEGIGVTKAIDDWKLLNGRDSQPEIVLVKGVSDQAGTDKKLPKDTMFFSELIEGVPEDVRQQMCTVMSLTLALRAILASTKFSGPSDELII